MQIASETPLITVGIVVRNRDWIIGKTLASLVNQTYPHDKLYVLIVDGKSLDQTVDVAKKILEKSDFKSYRIIVQECSIPEGRNICIANMHGDALFFLDSDVLISDNALSIMVKAMHDTHAEVIEIRGRSILVNSAEDLDSKLKKTILKEFEGEIKYEIPAVFGVSHSLLSKKIFEELRFDEELTIYEDIEFSNEVFESGFKVVLVSNVLAYDINCWKQYYSDIYVDMPLKYAIRGIRKKAKLEINNYYLQNGNKGSINFLLSRKRYLIYLGYVPALLLTIYGLFSSSLYVSVFPLYFAFFAIFQMRRRGIAEGLRATMRSFIVGVPNAFWAAIYSLSQHEPNTLSHSLTKALYTEKTNKNKKTADNARP